MHDNIDDLDGRIAVIGMAGRFPGARNVAEYWSNLRGGVESIRPLTDEELLAAGESLDAINDPAYVKAAAVLDDIDQFDAAFFGMSPRDAAVFDPQHRILLECAWEAFEHAGYVASRIPGAVGVFASCGLSEYMFKNVLRNEQVATSVGEWLIRHTGNDTNFLATRISYELDIDGPSLNVQTACSSTLVALHLACQSLLSGECDVALAGGAVAAPVQRRGYVYKEGEILSPDGHCRAFDAQAAGTVISSAAGCVVLKPLAAALADGDNVLAVIRGSAINNDGRDKVGYLAPSVGGQARVVTEALAVADVDPRDVSYIEAHGTGTLIGDPIEVAGLTQAYRQSTDDTQFCAIGSAKTNIGHTGEAAGVAAFIKTVLSLQHGELVPNLHFQAPNPQADFANSPFYVNAELTPWNVAPGKQRIAGVTGLGAGGTNAHVIVSEAPRRGRSGDSRAMQLVTVSARSQQAAQQAGDDLASHLRAHPDLSLADVAYTRLVGRLPFRARRAVVATSTADAAAAFASNDPKRVISQHHLGETPTVVFMMPGGGAQYAGMGRDLYDNEPVYRDAVDECCEIVNPQLGLDLRTLLFPTGDVAEASKRLERPSVALPALFTTEYAMATLLESWGVLPAAMIGHSAGEYVVACLAGVISLADGLALVALRGRLFETLPEGGMLSLSLGEQEARRLMPQGLSVAATNAADLCVVSGPVALLDDMERVLAEHDAEGMRVHIDVAAHSSMLEPILAEFGAFCRTIRFSPPEVPYVSNLTGTWITAAEATDPQYWVRHLRETVRFGEGIQTLLTDANRVLVEVGPGRTLAGFARMAQSPSVAVTSTLRHPREAVSDLEFALAALGRIWAAGADIDIAALFDGEERHRIALPTYPFERLRYWVDPDPLDLSRRSHSGPMRKRHDVADWFYTPSWRRAVRPTSDPDAAELDSASANTMIVADGSPLVTHVAAALEAAGKRVTTVTFGTAFRRLGVGRYAVNPARSSDWVQLVEALKIADGLPGKIVHLTAVGAPRVRRRFGQPDPLAALDDTISHDHSSLLFLAGALALQSHPTHLVVVTSGVHSVGVEELANPERALLHGAARVIPRELSHVTTVAVDIDLPATPAARDALVQRLVQEVTSTPTDDVVAYRRGERWVRSFEHVALPPSERTPWRDHGVYLITGGLGGIGLAIAEHIAGAVQAPTLVLVGRSTLPSPTTWDALLAAPDTDPLVRHRIESIRRIEAKGGTAILSGTDITNEAAVQQMIADVTHRTGRITGVVHSAGVLNDVLIALRPADTSSPVVDVKARGLLILDRALAHQPPELLVLCSSVSSILGLPGQVDYTAANAFLDAYAAKKNFSGETRVVVVNWNAWQEVGMAVAAVQASTPRGDATSVPDRRSRMRLFDQIRDEGERVTFSTRFSRAHHWLLSEHVVRGGDALIPGTGFIEMLRTAGAIAHGANGAIEISDVFFMAPFVVAPNEARSLHASLDRATSGVMLYSDSEELPHVTGIVRSVPAAPGAIDLDALRARCTNRVDDFTGYSDQPFMEFGPRWGNLRQVAYGNDEALITTQMPEPYVEELEALWLHPALLDMATGSAQALVPSFSPSSTFYVPFGYGRVLVNGPLPATAYSHVRLHAGTVPDVAVFDITICDATGAVVVEIEAFTMRRVSHDAAITARRPETPTELASPESPVAAALREGILSAEGVDALDRILSSEIGSQVVASSVDIHQWIAQVDAEADTAGGTGGDSSAASGPQFQRPNLGTEYAAPETPLEQRIALIWRDLLGLELVGRNDDFFELGGQSLIAIRLMTRLQREFGVRLQLSDIFELQTLGALAKEIERRNPGVAAQLGAPSANETVASGHQPVVDQWRSLVQVSSGGDGLPLFVVHGAGGNVLFLWSLAKSLEGIRPVFGFQAVGIDSHDQPDTSVELMAQRYTAELVDRHPGPYLLGGYSGGGLIALEMTRLLHERGAEVKHVLLLDSEPPGGAAPTNVARLKNLLRNIPRSGIRSMWPFISDTLERGYHKVIKLSAKEAARRAAQDLELGQREIEGYVNLTDHFTEVVGRFQLQRYAVNATLLKADKEWPVRPLDYGWTSHIDGRLDIRIVAGDHWNMFSPEIGQRLGQVVREALQEH